MNTRPTSLAQIGPLKVDLTLKEAAALHLAADLVVRVSPQLHVSEDQARLLKLATESIERALKAKGAVLGPDGWAV